MAERKITISKLNNCYKINIKSESSKMSTGYMVGMIIGFLFFLIVGIIMLIIWFSKNVNNEDINIDIVVSQENWEQELDKQLLIYNLGSSTDKIKLEIANKIKVLNS